MTQEPEVIDEIELEDLDAMRLLCGERDRNLRHIESRFRVTLHPRGNRLRVIGRRTAVSQAAQMIHDLYANAIDEGAVLPERIWGPIAKSGERKSSRAVPADGISGEDAVLVTHQNKRIGPKTPGQRLYIEAINRNAVVFGIGPAGTGKTYLAVVVAVQRLLSGRVNRIILTRPAVEAGEKLGFLPGDLAEKVNPYIRPLYDALHDMMPFERVQHMIDTQVIEVAPLAFMRGRTLNHAFIILDEAQNTTPEQMKMFLTRIGEGSQVVVTGDITQTDLPRERQSGLSEAVRLLHAVEGIEVVTLTPADVVRHPIVQRIIDAYEQDSARRPQLPLDP